MGGHQPPHMARPARTATPSAFCGVRIGCVMSETRSGVVFRIPLRFRRGYAVRLVGAEEGSEHVDVFPRAHGVEPSLFADFCSPWTDRRGCIWRSVPVECGSPSSRGGVRRIDRGGRWLTPSGVFAAAVQFHDVIRRMDGRHPLGWTMCGGSWVFALSTSLHRV